MNEIEQNIQKSENIQDPIYSELQTGLPSENYKETNAVFNWDTGTKTMLGVDDNDISHLISEEPSEEINQIKDAVNNNQEVSQEMLEKIPGMISGIKKWSMSSTKGDWYKSLEKAGLAFSDFLEQGSRLITGGQIRELFDDQARIFRKGNITLNVTNEEIKNGFLNMREDFQPGAENHPFNEDGNLKEGWQEISQSVASADAIQYENQEFSPAPMFEYILQYGLGGKKIYDVLGNVSKLKKAPIIKAVLAELGVEFAGATQKKDDVNLLNMLEGFGFGEESGTVLNILRESLAAGDDDTALERKLKNAAGNAPVGLGLGLTIKAISKTKTLYNFIKKLKYNKEGRTELSKKLGYSIENDNGINGDFKVQDKNGITIASFATKEEADDLSKVLGDGHEVQEIKSLGAAATSNEPITPVEVVDSAGFKIDENQQYKLNQGLPKIVKKKEDLDNLLNTLKEITVEGDAGKFWYEKSGQKILQVAQGDKDEAEKIIKLIALYSSNAAPTPNTAAALKAYYQFLDGKPINAGMTALDKKAEALLYEGKNFSGYKVNNFYNNLMMEVDPSKVDTNAITTDRWMLRAFGYETTGNPTQPQINFIESTIKNIAEEKNLTPYQVQAAMWASIRAGRDPKKIAALAGDDFELAINKNLGQISWETAPGAKYNFFPEYQSSNSLIKAEYHFDLTKAITDDNGVDIIAKRLGLITPGQFDKPGVYQNSLGELEFNPGTQTEFVAPVATGSGNVKLKDGFEARSEIDSSAKEVIEAYAYIKGKLLNQEAVAYHRPVYNAQKDLSNGIEVKYQLNDDELKNLTKALNDEFSEFPGFVIPIGTPDGFRLIINPDITGYSIKDFQIKSSQAINKIIDVQDEQVVAFSTNTGYIDIDGYQLEKLKSGTEGSSDLYRKIPDILSELEPRVEEVYKKYETEYGWTRPTIQ